MNKKLLACAAVFAALATASFAPVVARADDDPSMHQVYEAANSGHLDQAQTMIAQVLRDHPNSAKAHYVAAELDARQGHTGAARTELANAERLQPGLPFARPESVAELRAQLGERSGGAAPVAAPAGGGIPLGLILGVLAFVAVVWMLMRRRPTPSAYPAGYGPSYPGGGAPPAGYGPAGYGGYGPPAGGGIGSSIVSGLAVGAGVVAGEEIAHRLLDGDHRHGGFIDTPASYDPGPVNSDMGGADFGVSDSGSWDDSGGGADSGGGSDWS